MTDAKRTCPECGLEYVPKGRGRGCPHCLLRLAMPGAAEATGEGPGGGGGSGVMVGAGGDSAGGAAGARPLPSGLKSRFFGDYEILDELARGGMGVVYRARQLGLNRVVALKMIQAGHLLSTEARLRFRVEIELVAQLNHPNIVALHEAGEHEGIHYFTMRLVEGGNLGDRLAEGRPVRELVALLVKVCRTVHYAHQRGVLHRDLKPSNILVDGGGEPHVADFGLAKSLDHDTGFTYSSSILGSPNYMAPEQASSQSGPVSTAADVYGLGAILYQILTGRPPFQGKTAVETIRQVVDALPVPPRRVNPAADADLATIALKCLEKKPAERYGSADELARDLERWLQGMPILARPVGWTGQIWRWSRRHPAVAGLSLALVLALAALVAGVSAAVVRMREAQQTAVSHLRESLLDQARLVRVSKQPGVRAESLRLLKEAAALGGPETFRERARNEMLAALAFSDMTFVPQFVASGADPELVLLSPGLESLADGRGRTNLVMRGVGGAPERGRTPVRDGSGSDAFLTRVEEFSPDGAFVAVRTRTALQILEVATGRVCLATNGEDRTLTFGKRSDGVMTLFLEDGDGGVTEFALPGGVAVRQLIAAPPSGSAQRNGGTEAAAGTATATATAASGASAGRRPGWRLLSASPDGRWLAAVRRGELGLELWDVASGTVQWRGRPDSGGVTAVAWQARSQRVAVASSDGSVVFRRCDTGDAGTWLTLGVPARAMAIDGSGGLLAVSCTDHTVRWWELGTVRPIFQVRGSARRLWFDGSGTRLGGVNQGDQFGWLELSRSAEYHELIVTESSSWVERCEFGPGNRWIAAGHSGAIQLRRLRDGASLGQIAVERLPVFALDPAGGAMVTSDSRGVSLRPWEESASGRLEFGPPRRILEGQRWRAVAYSGDGRRLFAANAVSNAVYVLERPFERWSSEFGPHAGVDVLTASHDGSRVASGSTTGRDLRVWEAGSGRMLMSAPMNRASRLALSRDGRWLLVHGEQLELLDVNAGKPSPPLPFANGRPMTGPACFAPNGVVVAVVVDQNEVELLDLTAWRSLGRLIPPRESRLVSMAFSSDGTQLAAATAYGRMRVWNLAQLRRQLADVGLDWPVPSVPLGDAPGPAAAGAARSR